MENFKIIYKILKAIEEGMDYEVFDSNSISYEYLNISRERWKLIMVELIENEYITGVIKIPIMEGRSDIKLINPRLTLKGMEYLEDNSMMKKAYRAIKGVVDIVK